MVVYLPVQQSSASKDKMRRKKVPQSAPTSKPRSCFVSGRNKVSSVAHQDQQQQQQQQQQQLQVVTQLPDISGQRAELSAATTTLSFYYTDLTSKQHQDDLQTLNVIRGDDRASSSSSSIARPASDDGSDEGSGRGDPHGQLRRANEARDGTQRSAVVLDMSQIVIEANESACSRQSGPTLGPSGRSSDATTNGKQQQQVQFEKLTDCVAAPIAPATTTTTTTTTNNERHRRQTNNADPHPATCATLGPISDTSASRSPLVSPVRPIMNSNSMPPFNMASNPAAENNNGSSPPTGQMFNREQARRPGPDADQCRDSSDHDGATSLGSADALVAGGQQLAAGRALEAPLAPGHTLATRPAAAASGAITANAGNKQQTTNNAPQPIHKGILKKTNSSHVLVPGADPTAMGAGPAATAAGTGPAASVQQPSATGSGGSPLVNQAQIGHIGNVAQQHAKFAAQPVSGAAETGRQNRRGSLLTSDVMSGGPPAQPANNSQLVHISDNVISIDLGAGLTSSLGGPDSGQPVAAQQPEVAPLSGGGCGPEPANQPIDMSQLKVLDLSIMREPDELDMKLLWLAKNGDWLAVEELLANKRHYFTLKSWGSFELRRCVTEGALWTPVMYAARDNKPAIIEKLVRGLGYNVNACDCDNVTPLHLACMFIPTAQIKGNDQDGTIRTLLQCRANPMVRGGAKEQLPLHILAGKASLSALTALNLLLEACPENARLEQDGEGNIPLLIAVQAGNEGAVQDLLQTIPRDQLHFKRLIDDNYVIHMATKNKDIEILKLAIDYGSNLDLQNLKGQTALHIACEQELEEFVRLLCQAGADPDVQDRDHQSPLHVATARGLQRIVDILSEKFKASIMYRTKDGSTLMHLASSAYNAQAALGFIRKGIPIHMPNKEGAKCIHIASIRGHVEVVKAIVAKGENVDSRTKDGLTPLHLAVKFGKHELVEALLGLGANLQLKTTRDGETPLHLATLIKDGEDCVDLLIRSGADIDATENGHETPLHYATRSGNTKAMELLLNDGAKIDMQNTLGENILHVCVRESQCLLIKTILYHVNEKRNPIQAKKLINQQNSVGESSVHYAANLTGSLSHYELEDRDIMQALLNHGGDVFLQNFNQLQTPVHYNCQSGNTNILQEIFAHLSQQDCQLACNKPAKSLWTPLFYACYHGHPELIRMLINQTARIDVFDENGEAPLHVAVGRGHEQVVDILLEHNAFVNVRNKPGMTPLHIAAKHGFISMVLQLVTEHGAILDAMTLVKQTPLHLAAENGQLEVCETLLLKLGSDLNAIDNQSQTPLHLAARKNHADVLKLFLTNRPELLIMPNKNGYTCAHIAAMNGSLGAIKELLRFNRDAVIQNRIKKSGLTALHLASENGYAEIVRLLLQSGAKPSDENMLGETALHLAAKNGHVKVLHTIRNSDWKLCSKRNGLTALHVASNCGQTEFVAEMLRCRVPGGIRSERSSVDPKADFGLTPLHLACRNGHEGVVRMLLNSAGVQVDSPTEINKTIPVHLAAQGGHLLVAGLLISRSTDGLTKADGHGRTALHFSSAHGHKDMAALLIGQGAQMNYQDDRGWTALHYAARHGYLDVVKLLVESGADPKMTCNDDKVPICMAANAGHKEVLSYLLKKDHDSFDLMQDKTFLIDLMACSKQHNNRPIQEFILVSEAPIDIAVKLAKCYELLVEKDKDRAKDLVVARDLCDQVATDLLTIVASTNNATALLKSLDHNQVEFLDVLIELDRKDVVSQHSVQRYLSNVWIGSLSWSAWKFVLLFFGFLVFPPIWVAVSCPVGHRLATIPVIKFMSYLVSHLFFIILLVFTIINPWLPIYRWTNMIPPFHEWLLLLWFMGILATTMSNPPDKAGFGSIKLVNLVIGFTAITVHIFGGVFLSDEMRPYVLFVRNQLMALVLLLSFVELLNFLTFHHLFGPWAVIIQDLMKDMMRFLVIMGIFLLGFSLTVSAIYVPVFEPPQANLSALINVPGVSSPPAADGQASSTSGGGAGQQLVATNTPSMGIEFQSPLFTFEMLFYSLFGLVEPDFMPPMHQSPSFSKVIMKIVFGVYMMITVVVLINLLIAMMSNTYQRIEARSDIEWKFGRATLIRNMIRTSPTPSPLILLVGIWLDLYREFKRRQQQRQKTEKMAIAAFNRKQSVSGAASRAAQIWMSKSPRLAQRMAQRKDTQASIQDIMNGGAGATSAGQTGGNTNNSIGGGSGGGPGGHANGHTTGMSALSQAVSVCNVEAANIKRVNEVVNWSIIVKKYWENIGVIIKEEEEVIETTNATDRD